MKFTLLLSKPASLQAFVRVTLANEHNPLSRLGSLHNPSAYYTPAVRLFFGSLKFLFSWLPLVFAHILLQLPEKQC
jgi:hypothetical protein